MRPEFVYNKIVEELMKNKSVAVATIISKEGSGPRDIGAQLVVTEDGVKYGTIGGGSLENIIYEEAVKALREGKPKLLKLALRRDNIPSDAIPTNQLCGGIVQVFINVIHPAPRIIIAGGGNVGKPIADIANVIGFRVVVMDEKEELANPLRYPYAEKTIVGKLPEEVGKLEFGKNDIFIIAYGEVETDYQVLKKLVEMKFPGHIWALCSRNRCSWMIKRLLDEGYDLKDFKGRLHMPAGLDIRSDTPEEIAVSILAEVICVRKQCNIPVNSMDISNILIK
ncbi:XdhC family protein [Thermogladius sp. 4427co]|uniref:XdhC family protein n=1 Tax=Thermogladius sp. 4427co TaxID=3450718 RepID=UPI003F7AC4E7